MTTNAQYEQRYWSKVDKREREDCWLWQPATDSKGYQ